MLYRQRRIQPGGTGEHAPNDPINFGMFLHVFLPNAIMGEFRGKAVMPPRRPCPVNYILAAANDAGVKYLFNICQSNQQNLCVADCYSYIYVKNLPV